jgi:hypothetical protein
VLGVKKREIHKTITEHSAPGATLFGDFPLPFDFYKLFAISLHIAVYIAAKLPL